MQNMRVIPSSVWSKRSASFPEERNSIDEYDGDIDDDDLYDNYDDELGYNYDLADSDYTDYENGRDKFDVDKRYRDKRSFGSLEHLPWKRLSRRSTFGVNRRKFGRENMKDFRENLARMNLKSGSEVKKEIKDLKMELKDIKTMFNANKSIDKLLGISDVRSKMKERRAKRMLMKRKVAWVKK